MRHVKAREQALHGRGALLARTPGRAITPGRASAPGRELSGRKLRGHALVLADDDPVTFVTADASAELKSNPQAKTMTVRTQITHFMQLPIFRISHCAAGSRQLTPLRPPCVQVPADGYQSYTVYYRQNGGACGSGYGAHKTIVEIEFYTS